MRYFEKNCKPNNREKVDELNSQFDAKYKEFSANHTENCDFLTGWP